MPANELLYDYKVEIRGKIKAVDAFAAEQKLRMFLSMPLGIHDGIEDVNVHVYPDLDIEDMGRRFR